MNDTLQIMKSDSIKGIQKVILFSKYYYWKSKYHISNYILEKSKKSRDKSGQIMNYYFIEIIGDCD